MNRYYLLGLSTVFLLACSTESVVPEPSVQVDKAPQSESKVYMNSELGFRFEYPSDLVLFENQLWTREELDRKEADVCDPCIPAVTIRANELGDRSLEEFVIEDHVLGEAKTLAELAFFNVENSSFTYENVAIGANEFLRVEVPEEFHVIEYYTVNENVVVSFKVYFEMDDNSVLKEIMTSLQFNAF